MLISRNFAYETILRILTKNLFCEILGFSEVCKYPLHNRHANIKDATIHHPIFSVGGELITLAKSAFILCEIIKKFNSHYTSTQNFYKKPSHRLPPANNSTFSPSGLNSEKSRINHIRDIRIPSTPEPSSTSGPSTSTPSTSLEPLSTSNSSLPSIISSTPEQSSHPGLSSNIDKGKQPATLEKYMRTPSITTNNNFIPNHNTTAISHKYSDQSEASE
ncbi:hypothetical protein C2G38_2181640 [Gigaspora rosea]|uniref:Uncharacterized protein n=1 Tax=Gigaspora rosea TaxID=44941 RepID=A0A397VCQ3_9GLOM|nr:hypothetical protein C2G38_2181640 [Gigaspora rosea]